MKKTLLLFAVIALCIGAYGQEINKIDSELQEEMLLRNDDEFISDKIIMIVCDPISDLTSTLEYDKIVNLKWNRPENCEGLIGYYVCINGTQMCGTVTQEYYTFFGYEEGEFIFCVKAKYEDCVSASVCETVNILSICEPVTDLISNVDGYEVALSWNAPELISEVAHYNIYRNDEFLCTVETETFLVEETAGAHVYSVEVEYNNKCISEKKSVDVLVLEAPINLKIAHVDGLCAFELSWEYEDESMFFNLYRDEELIASNIKEKKYTDQEVGGCLVYCYFVKATNKEIESATSNEVCDGIVGIELSPNYLKIYPNPSKSVIFVEGEDIEKITILNFTGQIVKVISATGNLNRIDVSHLASGNYVFTIHYTNNYTENVKVIIK